MPQEGKLWRHVVIGTHGSWLPGSPKGWRSRGHKRHSSGDYNSPPPAGEHTALYAYSKSQCAKTVVIPLKLRAVIGRCFIETLTELGHRPLVISVSATHAHILAELPASKPDTHTAIGTAKRKSSRAVKIAMPGRIWAAGGKYKIVGDADYQSRVFDYITRHVNEGAWVWTFRDEAEPRRIDDV